MPLTLAPRCPTCGRKLILNTTTGYYECSYDGYSTDPSKQTPTTTQDAPKPDETA